MKKMIVLLIAFIVFAIVIIGAKATFETLLLAGLTAIFVRLILEGVD